MSDKIESYEATISEIDLGFGGLSYLIISIPSKSLTSIFRCRRQGKVELLMDCIWGYKEILGPEEAMRRYKEYETKQFVELVGSGSGIAVAAMFGAELIK